jgi:hypothetical protein
LNEFKMNAYKNPECSTVKLVRVSLSAAITIKPKRGSDPKNAAGHFASYEDPGTKRNLRNIKMHCLIEHGIIWTVLKPK